MNESDFDIVNPDPSALIESLRAFGYSVETSIADLIDNSITADATSVEIDFHWNEDKSAITIFDNGRGMAEEELREAMRAGSSNPLTARDEGDLGRFGLGLKTASFSQARSLTVGSRKGGGPVSIRRWDLDHVGATGRWELIKSARPESKERLGRLDDVHSGTLVIWELLDRIVTLDSDDKQIAKDNFYRLATALTSHLGMVFHRFISKKKLKLFVNKNEVEAWDPFIESNKATQQLPSERLRSPSGYVSLQPYVLPHHSKLSPEEHSASAGSLGWNASQGFYIYRADRLIQAGGWLSLGVKAEEHYKLARISIDITQEMDAEWAIDVRKARGRPPSGLRKDLKRVSTATRKRAQEVYRHRGKRLTPLARAEKKVDVWIPRRHEGKTTYVVNLKHDVIAEGLKIPLEHRRKLRAVVQLVERTVPVEQIHYDGMQDPTQHVDALSSQLDSELIGVAQDLYRSFRSQNMSVSEAQVRVMQIEPFYNFPEVVHAMSDDPKD